MLVFLGFIELPVCPWMQFDVEYTPTPRLIAITEIRDVAPHPLPEKGSFPPYKPPCCYIRTGDVAYYCFLSYEETCKRINKQITEFVTGATSSEHVMEWVPPSKE